MDSETKSEIKRIANYLNKNKSGKTLKFVLKSAEEAFEEDVENPDAFNEALKYVKNNFGKEGALFNLGPKIVKQKPSAEDERLGITKTKKKKRDPQTTPNVKARGNPITAQGKIDKIKDPERNFEARLNIEAPIAVAKLLGGVDRNPRKKFSGFDSESERFEAKRKRAMGFSQGGLVRGKKFAGIY